MQLETGLFLIAAVVLVALGLAAIAVRCSRP